VARRVAVLGLEAGNCNDAEKQKDETACQQRIRKSGMAHEFLLENLNGGR
jgi:hypothetical protein